MASGPCENCTNYVYDDECECYVCQVNLDEDELYRFLSGSNRDCPYFRLEDEYTLARRQ